MTETLSRRELGAQLQALPEFGDPLPKREIEIFIEIEAVLHLYELLCPRDEERDAWQAWALVSGYFIQGINDRPDAQRKCLLMRERLRYVKTSIAWRWWLRWYKDLHETARLYAFTQNQNPFSISFRCREYEVTLRNERLSVYEQLFDGTASEAEPYPRPSIEAGHFTFEMEGIRHEVEISQAMIDVSSAEWPSRELNSASQRPVIDIAWKELLETAQELDQMEADGQFPELGH